MPTSSYPGPPVAIGMNRIVFYCKDNNFLFQKKEANLSQPPMPFFSFTDYRLSTTANIVSFCVNKGGQQLLTSSLPRFSITGFSGHQIPDSSSAESTVALRAAYPIPCGRFVIVLIRPREMVLFLPHKLLITVVGIT